MFVLDYFRLSLVGFLLSDFLKTFQTIAIGYKQIHPDSVAVFKAFDRRPNILIKASESSHSFCCYGFVEAVRELHTARALGLLDPDFKVFLTS